MYNFPNLTHINDVLPAISGKDEFIVAEREHYDVINYVVAFQDTFDMRDENDINGAIRRECRGLIFDKSGNLISRPFHKFFNFGERDETKANALDFTSPHVVMEKMDGSMVRPLVIGDDLFLATKMGVTEIALDATKLLSKEQSAWLREMFIAKKTPLLEYISPQNKIVVQYDEPTLILLALRDNFTGEYSLPTDSPFESVPIYGNLGTDIDTYISKSRQEVGREGDIIRWSNGHMIKIKNDWYVRIHKTKDRIQTDRHILSIIINEELDDLIPILDETDTKTVLDYEARFENALHSTMDRIEGLVSIARTVYGGDRKRIALEMIPNIIYKQDAKFIFSSMDGKELRPIILDHIKKNVGNTAKYETLEKWMGI